MAERENVKKETRGEKMSKGSIKLNLLNMLNYYKKFDPIVFKYKHLLEKANDKLNTYLKFQKYEEEKQFAELTRKEFWDLQENLDMAYANRKVTDNFLAVYDLICEKIIHNYIHIDGMERLFSEKYSEFEWEMHLGIDYKKHSMDFYRDHFIHQVKDAYSMAMLLENCGFYKKVHDILNNESSSKIARYVNKLIGQQLRLPLTVFEEDLNTKYSQETLKEHYIYNIIYMSSYIAGLFHDIGYPAAVALENGQRMVDYLVEMHHFEQGGYDFRKIMSLLQNSLLFRIVSPQEIRGCIEGTKVDHGVMSALLLLLHFYENGAIHRLEPYKICAVELAALAIYNHTNEYTCVGDKNASYERPIFTLDPISYLLRVCDDLQEWGRIYFEVSDKSNMIICNYCRMPIIRKKIEEDIEDDEGEYDVDYRCSCKSGSDKDGWLFAPMFRYKQFSYRRVHNTTVCREVEISSYDAYQKYRIHIDYELDRLLHIAYINPNYAKYRIKELAKLKHFFPRQDKIELVFMDYFVTANIILIKSMIVGEFLAKRIVCGQVVENYLEKNIGGLKREMLTEADREKLYFTLKNECIFLMKNYKKDLYKVCIPKDIGYDKEKEYLNKCEKYLNNAFSIYTFVYLLICVGQKINTNGYIMGQELGDEFRKILDRFMNDLKSDFGWFLIKSDLTLENFKKKQKLSDFCSEEVKILLKDCCIQAGRMFTNLDNYAYYPDSYFSTYCSDDNIYSTLKQFMNTEKYCPMIDKNENTMQLDAYSDLYSIREILKKL